MKISRQGAKAQKEHPQSPSRQSQQMPGFSPQKALVIHQSLIYGSSATGGLSADVENKAHTGWQAARGTR
jgi:hypothetical protein